jgi:internalin A
MTKMAPDMELLKELEKEISMNRKRSLKLEQRELAEIKIYDKIGYYCSEDGCVIGLNLNEIKLVPFSVTLSQFKHIEILNLYGTGITDISFLKNFCHLKALYLGGNNQITNYSILRDLAGLQVLDLRYSSLEDVSFLRGLNRLTALDLSANEITGISFLQDMPHLTTLNLNNNKITDVSPLQCLRNLTSLDLSHNDIVNIPFMEGMTRLTGLDLRDNKIRELPEEFVALKMEIDIESKGEGKRGIFVSGNPLEIPPVEIVRKGKPAIINYFQSIEGEKRLLNEVKVLFVGDGGSGKTSLVKRLLEQGFDINEPQTHGINIKPWNIEADNIEMKAHLWDFGGQEIMHATHQFFLSKRSLYILVLDGRKDEKTEYWLKHIESFGGDSPILVVINKIDANPSFDINRRFLADKYNNIRGFHRISCAAQKGIKPFARALKEELANVELIKTTWPITWFNIKTQLEQITEHFISYDRYKKMCEAGNIVSEKRRETLLDFLNDLGVVLHFKDFELVDTHVLEPKWLTEAVYKIINSERLSQSKGVLNLRVLDDILQKKTDADYYYPRDKYKYIITLMKKFELCYGIDDETVLIPDLLEVQEPRFDFDYGTALTFIIEYDFLPRSVMPRFIVNIHRDIKNRLQWRTGVVLEDKDFESTAVIKADNEAKRIYIYVNGEQKRDYFAAVLGVLRRINRSFEKLETTELVSMPDAPDITVSYKHLIRLEKEEIEFYLPGESEKKYKVKDLLGSIGGEIEEDETLQMLKQIKIAQMQRKPVKKDR